MKEKLELSKQYRKDPLMTFPLIDPFLRRDLTVDYEHLDIRRDQLDSNLKLFFRKCFTKKN